MKNESISVEIGRICKKRPNRTSVRVVTIGENVEGWIEGRAFRLGFENAADSEEIDGWKTDFDHCMSEGYRERGVWDLYLFILVFLGLVGGFISGLLASVRMPILLPPTEKAIHDFFRLHVEDPAWRIERCDRKFGFCWSVYSPPSYFRPAVEALVGSSKLSNHSSTLPRMSTSSHCFPAFSWYVV